MRKFKHYFFLYGIKYVKKAEATRYKTIPIATETKNVPSAFENKISCVKWAKTITITGDRKVMFSTQKVKKPDGLNSLLQFLQTKFLLTNKSLNFDIFLISLPQFVHLKYSKLIQIS
ncbi:hypothetical protein [Campylobacter sp. CCUG 57310]|uniref:hypothetical protein n=1 Tax=Campylobacter sp. CCUG 57310 TaxID=2517362 RepID=UPI00156747D7|nr:hypothetical protein [Campylobacter sp. CCUG 57310]QKF92237.1 hypothetical protein CORI_1041 [Campylobacter sp. CCUG 57310]